MLFQKVILPVIDALTYLLTLDQISHTFPGRGARQGPVESYVVGPGAQI